jgi:hypothetical protein
VVTPTYFPHSYRFLASTGYNSNAGECVRDYQCGEEEISVDVLIEEQRRLSHSKNLCERVVGSLCVGAILKKQLMELPNSTISQLMTDHIWCQLNLLGPESVIVEIASERLIESAIAIAPKAASAEKCETPLVCPECGAEFWRAYE